MNTKQQETRTEPRAPIEPARLPARRPAPQPDDTMPELFPPLLGVLVGVLIIVVAGILLGGSGGLAGLSAALLGAHSAWYLSRASAFVGYILLWWSMVLGIGITNRLARVWPGGPAAGDLHEHASLLGLVFGVLHALVLLGDKYIGYTLPQILIPFAGAAYMPFWVGLGQIGLYLMALVTLSFYVRRSIGTRAWRVIHYLSYAVFALTLVHGITSGTDTSAPWAIWMYWSSAITVVALTIYRVWVHRRGAAGAAANRTPSAT